MVCPPIVIEPAQEFTCFSDLPVELRLKIWREAALERDAVVEMLFRLKGTRSDYPDYPLPLDRIRPTSPPPAVLQVNREAQSEALRMLDRLSLATAAGKGHYSIPIYFNPTTDVIRCMYACCGAEYSYDTWYEEHRHLEFTFSRFLQALARSLSTSDLLKVQRLEIDNHYWNLDDFPTPLRLFVDDIVRFPSLASLVIALRSSSTPEPLFSPLFPPVFIPPGVFSETIFDKVEHVQRLMQLLLDLVERSHEKWTKPVLKVVPLGTEEVQEESDELPVVCATVQDEEKGTAADRATKTYNFMRRLFASCFI